MNSQIMTSFLIWLAQFALTIAIFYRLGRVVVIRNQICSKIMHAMFFLANNRHKILSNESIDKFYKMVPNIIQMYFSFKKLKEENFLTPELATLINENKLNEILCTAFRIPICAPAESIKQFDLKDPVVAQLSKMVYEDHGRILGNSEVIDTWNSVIITNLFYYFVLPKSETELIKNAKALLKQYEGDEKS